jgi:hypothetical protein
MGIRSGLWIGQSISETLLSTNHSWSIIMVIQTIVVTELVFCRRQYVTGQNVLVSFRV